MDVLQTPRLLKLGAKNRGNRRLENAILELLKDLQRLQIANFRSVRTDADLVHPDGFYFFDLHLHRVLVWIYTIESEYASILWASSHDDYERIFRNNRTTIEKWLREKGYL